MIMQRDPHHVSDMAFIWASFSAAETLLHSLSRKSDRAVDHADLLIDFIHVGDIGLSPNHFINKTIDLQPWLLPYKADAVALVNRHQTERGQPCAK
tara:strand:+ start:1623 stop:1910 length:288 start_codon:yes stop_codon:yes gene_type:complete